MKLGKREHLELFRTGMLYMNTLSYFRNLEADVARGDKLEGVTAMIQPRDLGRSCVDTGIRTIGRIEIRPEDLAGPIRFSMKRTVNCHLFCLYALTAPARGSLFAPEHLRFGDSVVAVLDTQDFLSRVKAAAEKQKIAAEGQLVEYYDENVYGGRVGRYKKSSRFAYQHEYRIALESGVDGPFQLSIGNIRNITTEVIPLNRADELLRFTEDDAKEAGLSW